MILSETTLDRLKHLSVINPSIRVEANNRQAVNLNIEKNMCVVLDLGVEFEETFSFYDSRKFFNAIKRLDDPNIVFKSNLVEISENSTKFTIPYSDERFVEQRKMITLPESDFIFTLPTIDEDNMKEIMSGLAVLNYEQLIFIAADGELNIISQDKDTPSALPSFRYSLESCPDDLSFEIAISAKCFRKLYLNEGHEYDISFSSKNIIRMRSSSSDFTYFFGGTKYTSK